MNMGKILRGIGRWIIRLLIGFVLLIALLVIVFQIFRGSITDKAVQIINEQQAGEISLGRMSLRPLQNFPDVSLKFRDVSYQETESTREIDAAPILQIDNVFVSLDLVQLIKGRYEVSKIRLGDGELNYMVGADSISNIEKALGLDNIEETDEDTSDTTQLYLDLESLEIRNLAIHYSDIPSGDSVELQLNGFESGFSYFPEQITATVMLHSELNKVHLKGIKLGKPRSVSFSSSLQYDRGTQVILLEQSMVDVADAVFEMNGEIDVREKMIDLGFSARNSGIDLLNFLLSGVLDMDAIEQTGEGMISMEGTAKGSFDQQVPLLSVDVRAMDLGFRIHAIEQSVSDIRFRGYFTNGAKADLSEAALELQDFHVKFPRGEIDANLAVENLVDPSVRLEWAGDADLSLINEIIETRKISKMRGDLRFAGGIDGVIDKSSGRFLEDAGALSVFMKGVSFSLPENEITDLSGELYLEEKYSGVRDVEMQLDNNNIHFEIQLENFLPYLMDFAVVPGAMVAMDSETLYLERIIGDTIFQEPITDLGFRVDITTGAGDFKKLLGKDAKIPDLRIVLQNFQADIPGLPPFSRVKGMFNTNDSVIDFSRFMGKIGDSDFDIDGVIGNYNAYLKKDSSSRLYTRLKVESDRLRASDFLQSEDENEGENTQFANEEIQDLLFKVNIETTVSDILEYSGLPNVKIQSEELKWKLKNYPDPFTAFTFDIEKSDSLLHVRNLSGRVGESNLEISSRIYHLFDSIGRRHGELSIRSDLLDIDRFAAYQPSGTPSDDATKADSIADRDNETSQGSLDLDKISFPDLDLSLDIRELRIGGNGLQKMKGMVRLKPYKVVYFDKFSVRSETGGIFSLDGQFNLIDPEHYILSANLEIDTVDVRDFDLPIAIGDSVYSLEENFNGILSAKGLAEFFINPDLSLNIDLSTAMFYITLEEGRVKNFAPLKELSRFTGKKELTNLKFGKLSNPRGFTLSDGKIDVPLMKIESTLGVILLEGTQYLDGDFLYLARVPWDLVKETMWNLLTGPKESKDEQVREMETQKFMPVTIYSKDGETEVKRKDRRDQYKLRRSY